MAVERLRQVALIATFNAVLLPCATAWGAAPSRLEVANPLATFAPSVKHFDPAKRQFVWVALPKDKLIIEVKIQARPSKGSIGPIDLASVSLQLARQRDGGGEPSRTFPLFAVGNWNLGTGCTYFDSDGVPVGGSATVALKSGEKLELSRSQSAALRFSAAITSPLMLCMAFLAPKTASGALQLRIADLELPVVWDLQQAPPEPRP